MSDVSEKQKHSIQLQIDESVAQGTYSNLVVVNHSENEFVLDFAFLQPYATLTKVRARIVCSPQQTKRILQMLQLNVTKYEEKFGTIKVADSEPPPVAPPN